jgi:hypothetical protein
MQSVILADFTYFLHNENVCSFFFFLHIVEIPVPAAMDAHKMSLEKGEKRKMGHPLYREVARTINQTVGRNAVTADQLAGLVKEAKQVRRRRGTTGLMQFANELPYRYLTEEEVYKLQQSPRYRELSFKMIDLMVVEQVITPFEAMLLKRRV